MPELTSTLPWAQPGWLDEASAWIQNQLAAAGQVLDGPVEQAHVRPWSVILRAAGKGGAFFFKASAPVLKHEPGLTQTLFRWRSDCMQAVLAVDTQRAWMLMPDSSPMLRTLIQSPEDLAYWQQILPLYAGVQREMIGRKEDLLALGMLDRRLSRLPALFEALLCDRDALLIDQPDGLTAGQYAALVDLVPRYQAMCARLAAFGIPETLHHDDFHDANVFVPGRHYAFSDWGESCITHPFFSMLVTLRSIAYRFDWPYGASEHGFNFAPEILRLRDLYLSHWSDYGAPRDLLEIFRLAWKAGMVNRALTWHQVVSHLTEDDRLNHAGAVPAWLSEFLDAMRQPDTGPED